MQQQSGYVTTFHILCSHSVPTAEILSRSCKLLACCRIKPAECNSPLTTTAGRSCYHANLHHNIPPALLSSPPCRAKTLTPCPLLPTNLTHSQNEAVDDKGTNIKCTFFLESRAKDGNLTIDAFVNDALEVYKMQQITKVDLSRWVHARTVLKSLDVLSISSFCSAETTQRILSSVIYHVFSKADVGLVDVSVCCFGKCVDRKVC